MSLLQPDHEDESLLRNSTGPNEPGSASSRKTSKQQSTSQMFPKLRWECLQHRLQTLKPVSETKNLSVIHELSNVCSQLFDVQYKSLAMLKRNKVTINEENIF